MNTTSNESIVSMGAGSGASELLSPLMCLCLDIDRRALYAGILQQQLYSSNSLTVFALFDYTKGITELLHEIKSTMKLDLIRVLVQHPSPSVLERFQLCA